MKAINFIINTNILIALTAVALTFASQVQLGLHPQFHSYIFLIFFATLLNYNFHRFVTINKKTAASQIEKYKWASEHLALLKIILIIALAGIMAESVFVKKEILYLLLPLALLSAVYTFLGSKMNSLPFRTLRITGIKTILIAFVWSAVTILIPFIQADDSFLNSQVFFVFAERFTFIFAIAIPFDIRDLEIDLNSGFKTIPQVFGENNAFKISNAALLISLGVAIAHYLNTDTFFVLPAYILSIVCTFIVINTKALKTLNLYHHGILDGSILLNGVLILLSFYV